MPDNVRTVALLSVPPAVLNLTRRTLVPVVNLRARFSLTPVSKDDLNDTLSTIFAHSSFSPLSAPAQTQVPLLLRTMQDSGDTAPYGKCKASDTYGGAIPDSTSGTCSDGTSGTTHYYFYNITNAKDMVESGATPELTEIHVALDWITKDFDVEYSEDDSGDEVVSYRTYTHYHENEDYKEALASKITQINPIYFAGIPGLAGTEKTVYMGFSYLVMENMAGLYNESMRAVSAGLCNGYNAYYYCNVAGQSATAACLTSDTNYAEYQYADGYCAYCSPADFPVGTVDLFYGTMPGSCTGDLNSAFGLFGNYSKMESLIEDNDFDPESPSYPYGTRGLGSDSILYSDFIYSAIATVDQTTADSIVVEPELSTWARTGNLGCTTWGAFNQYYWSYYWIPDAEAAYSMQTACDLTLTSDQVAAFFEAFSDETFSTQFLAAVYAWYSVSNAAGTASAPSSAGVDNTVITGLGYSYRTAYYTTDLAGYGMSLYEVLADSRCVNAGVNYGNAFMVFQYLADYSVEQFMLKGFVVGYHRDRTTGTLSLNADGTGFHNSGLITTHTISEFLFGYNDTLADYVTTMSYNGIVGKQYDSIEDMVSNVPKEKYSKYTGKDNTEKYAQWYQNKNGNSTIQTRADLGYTWSNIKSEWVMSNCAEEPWLATNYGSDNCYIWQKCEDGEDTCDDKFGVEIQGASSGSAFEPFFEMSENLEVFAESFQRKLTFTARSSDLPEFGLGEMVDTLTSPELYAGYDLHGIKTIRYDMDASNFENSTANDVYYMGAKHEDVTVWADTWMMPLDRIAYYPVAYSKPWLCDTAENVQSKVTVTKSKDTEDMDCSDVEPYIAVEPLTGITLEKQLMFQVNWQPSTTMLDGTLFTNVTTSTRSLPFFWTGQRESIAADDALTLKTNLFDNVPMAVDALISGVVLGFCFIMAATLVLSQGHHCCKDEITAEKQKATEMAPNTGMV
mmetsp:Transcript_26156/g.69610  ORF Transcript_26156/g.69610 Transcript_26156/m.69610 type:complete len:959 (+) Transcript_26156:289-3165(+)